MQARLFDKKRDYEELYSWFEGWKMPPLPKEFLPEIGLIVGDVKTDYAVGFLYRTDSAFCWLEWITGNPKETSIKRNQALDILIKDIIDIAQAEGFKAIHMSLRHEKLIKKLESFGFDLSDEGITNMTKVLM